MIRQTWGEISLAGIANPLYLGPFREDDLIATIQVGVSGLGAVPVQVQVGLFGDNRSAGGTDFATNGLMFGQSVLLFDGAIRAIDNVLFRLWHHVEADRRFLGLEFSTGGAGGTGWAVAEVRRR